MISEDEYLERIVAGIHSVTTTGAEVTWNEKIGGRQFDVVVRFAIGTLRYLVLVEVKNRSRRASASDLEAFVQKSRDHHANKAVFVTVAGFQQGAMNVAKRHGVDLFTVKFDTTEPRIPSDLSGVTFTRRDAPPGYKPELSVGEPTLHAAVEKMRLTYTDGERHELPSEQSQMSYYVGRTTLEDGRSLLDVLHEYPVQQLSEDERVTNFALIDPPQLLTPKDDYFFPAGEVRRIDWDIVGRMARPLTGDVLVDPGMFVSDVVYSNALTAETLRFPIEQLPLGDSKVVPGKFYFITNPLNYYHCAKIVGELVTWEMIESFQCGQLIRATYTQNKRWARTYIPVTDKKVIRRLAKRLNDHRAPADRASP